METDGEPKIEAAFTDARRFARIRLVDCAAEDIRKTTPLKENGPDPVIDKNILTEEWLMKKMKSKHVPVKALLLDQANISGIGNWVGYVFSDAGPVCAVLTSCSDEILYHAKLHPEQYSDTFSPAQLKQLHTSLRYVCQTAVDSLGDSSKFPEEWLFNHRWGKGKKDARTTLPNGAKITHITVGGRTSCVVPSVQKKTGLTAGDLKTEEGEGNKNGVKDSGRKKAPKGKKATPEDEKPERGGAKAVFSKKRKLAPEAEQDEPKKVQPEAKAKTKKRNAGGKPNPLSSDPIAEVKTEVFGEERRRSSRVSKVKT